MSRIIVHKDGAYNLYSTVADGPIFDRGVTEQELRLHLLKEHGLSELENTNRRIERAKAKGTSSHIYENLSRVLSCNRAGPQESCMSEDAFVSKFLTIRG